MITGLEREITREQYDRGISNSGYLTKEDREVVFTDAERLGYGIYGGSVHEVDGKYYVWYSRGSSCD